MIIMCWRRYVRPFHNATHSTRKMCIRFIALNSAHCLKWAWYIALTLYKATKTDRRDTACAAQEKWYLCVQKGNTFKWKIRGNSSSEKFESRSQIGLHSFGEKSYYEENHEEESKPISWQTERAPYYISFLFKLLHLITFGESQVVKWTLELINCRCNSQSGNKRIHLPLRLFSASLWSLRRLKTLFAHSGRKQIYANINIIKWFQNPFKSFKYYEHIATEKWWWRPGPHYFS